MSRLDLSPVEQLDAWAKNKTLLTMRSPGHEEMGYITEEGKWMPVAKEWVGPARALCNLTEVFGEHPIEPLMEEIALHDKGCQVYETYSLEDCDCMRGMDGMEPDG